MGLRGLIFIAILILLFLYTGIKASYLLPGRSILAWSSSALLFFFILTWQIVYRSHPHAVNSWGFEILAWAGSLSMGLWATFIIFSIPFDLGRFLFFTVQKFVSSNPIDPERRTVLSRLLSLSLFGASAGITGLGFLEVATGARVKEITVPIPDLPPELDGLKIAQISDLHVGPTIRQGYVEQVVRKVMSFKPDLIAVTGDLADGTPQMLEPHLRPLADLKAPLGTYSVTGNHEYYWGALDWIEKTRQLGFIPLLNENQIRLVNGIKILIGGVTDTSGDQFVKSHRSDPRKAAATAEECQFKLLLAHRPDSCFEAEPAGFDLQLSGHTHAGQFFPWSLFVRLAHKYYRGLNRHGKMWVYVNAGTGYWGPAHRFMIPSEITLLRLVSQARKEI